MAIGPFSTNYVQWQLNLSEWTVREVGEHTLATVEKVCHGLTLWKTIMKKATVRLMKKLI